MVENISVENYDNLLIAVAEQGFYDYVHSRVILEKNKVRKIKYKSETIEKAEKMIIETTMFFRGELVQKLYSQQTFESIIEILEGRVTKEIDEWKKKEAEKKAKKSRKRKESE